MLTRFVRARREPLSRKEPFRPVFLVGSGRSGTTLVRRLLMSGARLYIPPEVFSLGQSIADYQATLAQLKWSSRCRLVLGHFGTLEDFDLFPSQLLRPVLNKVEKLPRGERSLARIIDAFYAHMAEEAGFEPARWGDKTPANSLHLEPIRAVFPKARFVHVLRDGFDVVASFWQMKHHSDVAHAARTWERRVGACQAFADRHPQDVRTLRYERLVADPDAEMRQLCEWLDLTFDPDAPTSLAAEPAMSDVERHAHYSNVAKPVTADRVGKGRAMFSEQELKIVSNIIGPRMATFGYPV